MTRAFVSLGGNVGPVERTLEQALRELDAHPAITVRSYSSWMRTKAVGAAAGPDFLNGAAELHTGLDAFELLDVLLKLEDQHGRVRTGRWSPRTLDLDLVLYGDAVVDAPRLRVPHPACWYRRFVLDPLAEIAPDVIHPVKGTTMAGLRDRLLVRPLPVAVAGGSVTARQRLREQLAPVSPETVVSEWNAAAPAALLFWLGPPLATERAAAEPVACFEDLPILPRLDISQAADSAACARDVLTAALG